MAHHLGKAVRRQVHRVGAFVTVRRTVGTLDPVTSTRPSTTLLEVETVGVLRRRTQRSMKGDPLSTEDVFYLVSAEPFKGAFVPRDADLVRDAQGESRILSVRTRERSGGAIAYELYVSGVYL
jgi:predicted nucleic acid-binding protein